jgi:hypothetical protein
MDLRSLIKACALALAGLAFGCSDKCKSNCEDYKKCADATPDQKATDCGKECDNDQQAVDKANCSSQFDNFNNCESDQKDLCTAPENACSSQREALVNCMAPFCLANPSNATCAEYLQSN